MDSNRHRSRVRASCAWDAATNPRAGATFEHGACTPVGQPSTQLSPVPRRQRSKGVRAMCADAAHCCHARPQRSDHVLLHLTPLACGRVMLTSAQRTGNPAGLTAHTKTRCTIYLCHLELYDSLCTAQVQSNCECNGALKGFILAGQN